MTSAQVKTLLGAPASGLEKDPQAPVYKTCNWATTPPGTGSATTTPAEAASAATMDLGLIRIGNGEVGFGSTLVGLSATVLSGLGDVATYSAGKSATGTQERLLVTKKGTVSLSISVVYGASVSPPSSIQQHLTAAARAIFADLHA